jgi:hypothetical protein
MGMDKWRGASTRLINRARVLHAGHSLARRIQRNMYKFLVLVGFVATALAVPAPMGENRDFILRS